MSSTPTDPASIEREIKQRQASLASTVDELAGRVAPKALAQRTAASAQEKVKAAVLDEDGALRVERIAAVGAAAVGLIGAAIWGKKR
jgi:hypothetical protein